MKTSIYGLTCELLDTRKTGNLFYKEESSRKRIENIMEFHHLDGFIEPNIAHTSNMLTVDSLSIAKALNPWNAEYTKCDAICIKRESLKSFNMGLLGRSSDSMIFVIVSQNDIYMFNASIGTINQGLLKKLPYAICNTQYIAIMGPCISNERFCLRGDEYINQKTGNFSKLEYNRFIEFKGTNLHIDIKGIVIKELTDHGIPMFISDSRCTYDCEELGSSRREGINRTDNAMIVYSI